MRNLTFPPETNLPPELQGNQFVISSLQSFVKQWTQLICWTWVDKPVFDGSEALNEAELKKYLIFLLQRQAQQTIGYVEYMAPNSAEQAKELGDTIRELFKGKPYPSSNSLTLERVYNTMTGTNGYNLNQFFTEFIPNSNYMRIEVLLGYAGGIMVNPNPEKDPGSPAYDQDKYIALITYPPRPVYSEATVMKKQVEKWMKNTTPGEYFPPSVYISLTT